VTEPGFGIAHPGDEDFHADRYEESLDVFTRIHALKPSARDGESADLRAWDDHALRSLKLTRHHTTGVSGPRGGRTVLRCRGPLLSRRHPPAPNGFAPRGPP